ncbi:MAG: hypothetical protein ACHQZS_00215 [Candidatus Binatales bacterium]
MNESAAIAPDRPKAKAAKGSSFGVFRDWRAREHPRTCYQIAPRVWRPESLAQFEGAADANLRAIKNWEPRLTGFAYSDRDAYLVEVAAELSAERVGRVLYLVDLWRRDPDWSEHRGKRMHLVMLVRDATADMINFARRRRIRVVLVRGDARAAAPAALDRVNKV